MNAVLPWISWVALAATILPSCFYYTGTIDLNTTQWIMLAATIAWFVTTPLWMGREDLHATADST
jgi:hypothetical protein